jgi:hypothetical protein
MNKDEGINKNGSWSADWLREKNLGIQKELYKVVLKFGFKIK